VETPFLSSRVYERPGIQVPLRAGSLAGRTSFAYVKRFQLGTGVERLALGTNRVRSTRRYLWM
jgi:hypothetical protein